MKKKSVRRKATKKSPSYNRYLVIGFVIAALLFIAAISYQSLKNANVLGTSSFLAKDGIESSEDANKTPEPKEIKVSETPSNESSEIKTPEPKEIHTPEPREIKTPESRTIRTQLNSVSNLNQNRVEVQVEGKKMEINAAEEGSQVQLKTEDDGSLKMKIKKADGTEVEIENHALEQINEALAEQEIEIGTTSAKGFAITNKNTKAETDFHVNVNLASRKLSVDTPLGPTDLSVLPNQAVQNVLAQKVIDRISESSLSGSAGAQLQLIELKLFANKPVFQVQGVDDKKLLGILPIGVQKTTLISAETGQVVKTNEDIVNRILDIFSSQ